MPPCSPAVLIDTHAHLDDDQFQNDLPAVLQRAAAAGVRQVITIATTAPSSAACIALAEQFGELSASVGIQPNNVAEAAPTAWDDVIRLVEHPSVVAVGETGLDRHWNYTPFPVASDAPAAIRLVDGSAVELAPATKARLLGKHDGVRQAVELGRGAGKFKVVAGGGTFRVETAMGNVSVLGTEFSVKLEPRSRREGRKRGGRLLLSVSVTEGSVSVRAEGKNTVLRAGENRVFGRERREDDD
jgi:hypothetical protein